MQRDIAVQRSGPPQDIAVQRDVAVQRQEGSGEGTFAGIWRHLEPKLEYLKDNWWSVLVQTGRQLLMPWEGLGKDVGELWKEIQKGWSAIKSFQISKLIDAMIAVNRMMVGIIGRFYGVVRDRLRAGRGRGRRVLRRRRGASRCPRRPQGGRNRRRGPGDRRGDGAGRLPTQGLLKAAYNLTLQGDTGAAREDDYEQIANSGLTLAVLGALVLLSAIAVRFGKYLVSRVRGMFRPKAVTPRIEPPTTTPKAEPPKTQPPTTEPTTEPPKTEPATEPPKTEPATEPPKTEPAGTVDPAVRAKLLSDISGSRQFAKRLKGLLDEVKRPGHAQGWRSGSARSRTPWTGWNARPPRRPRRRNWPASGRHATRRSGTSPDSTRISRPISPSSRSPGRTSTSGSTRNSPTNWSFRGNDDLNPTPQQRGGEGQLFLSEQSPLQALKRWFKSRLGDMGKSVDLLRRARAAIDGDPALRGRLEVVDVYRQGNDWVLRDFDPDSLPLARALDDPAVAAARQQLIDALQGASDPILRDILTKLENNSANLHWSPARERIIVIDVQ